MIRPLRRVHRRAAWGLAVWLLLVFLVGWRAHVQTTRARDGLAVPALPGEVAR